MVTDTSQNRLSSQPPVQSKATRHERGTEAGGAASEVVASRFTARDALSASALAVLLILAASAFTRIYSGSLVLFLLAGAAVLSVGLSVALRALRTTLPSSVMVSVMVSIVGMIGYLILAVALTRQPGTGGIGPLFLESIRNSGAQILTSTIPVLPTPQTVVLPLVVVWLAGLTGAELTLRTRAVLAGFVAPTMAYVIALVLVGPNAAASLPLAVAFAGVAALGLAFSGDTTISSVLRQLGGASRKAFRIRRAAIGGVGLVALMLATLILAPSVVGLSDARPADPRTRIPPPEQQLLESNPLGRLSGWARVPEQQLFTVQTNVPSRIRWVTLTDYNGLSWLPGSEYRAAGSVLPANAPAPEATVVNQEYTMLTLDGLWLPAVQQPREVNDVRVSYDPTTGSLVTAEGLRTGLQYDVRSRRPDFNVGRLSDAALSDSSEIRRYADVPPNLPDGIVSLATSVIAPAATPYNRALLIEQFLLRNFTFSPEASSGHGLANLNFFLTVAQEQGGQRGTSEQFATAFALLARIAGLPTRVSVGFHAGTPQGDGRFLVTSGDAFAWPEVYFAGYGWVPFDPSPRPDNSAPIPPDQATPEAQQQNLAKQNQLRELENPNPEPAPDGLSTGTRGQATGEKVLNAALVLGVGLATLLILGLLAVVIGRALLRRRRLGAVDPAERVVGAWTHVTDAMRLARRRPSPQLTAHEVADLAVTLTPGHPQPLPSLHEHATAVNAVAFAPSLISNTDADQAVSDAREYVKQLRKRQRWLRRALWPLRPGPLLWVRSRRLERERAAQQPPSPPTTPADPEALNAQLVWAPLRSVHTQSEKAS